MGLAARVKQDTLDLHAATERAFAPFDLRTRDGYRAFLRAQAMAYLPLEDVADRGGVGRWLPDWPARRRGDLLRADLDTLGVSACDLHPLRAPPADPLGVAYVLEGSRHGGRVLLRDVLAGGDRVATDATRFLRHALEAGWWRRVLDALELYGADPERTDAFLAGASASFALFGEGARAVSAMVRDGATPGPLESASLT